MYVVLTVENMSTIFCKVIGASLVIQPVRSMPMITAYLLSSVALTLLVFWVVHPSDCILCAITAQRIQQLDLQSHFIQQSFRTIDLTLLPSAATGNIRGTERRVSAPCSCVFLKNMKHVHMGENKCCVIPVQWPVAKLCISAEKGKSGKGERCNKNLLWG